MQLGCKVEMEEDLLFPVEGVGRCHLLACPGGEDATVEGRDLCWIEICLKEEVAPVSRRVFLCTKCDR